MTLKRILSQRFGFIILLILITLGISVLTRTILFIFSLEHVALSWHIPIAFFVGVVYDLATTSYYAIPFVLVFMLIPDH